jgi:hypothetical protein
MYETTENVIAAKDLAVWENFTTLGIAANHSSGNQAVSAETARLMGVPGADSRGRSVARTWRTLRARSRVLTARMKRMVIAPSWTTADGTMTDRH